MGLEGLGQGQRARVRVIEFVGASWGWGWCWCWGWVRNTTRVSPHAVDESGPCRQIDVASITWSVIDGAGYDVVVTDADLLNLQHRKVPL